MKMKKIIAIVASLTLSATILAGCGSENTGGENNKGSEVKKISVGLATDDGGLNDKSFNQIANEGLEKAKADLGIEYNYIEAQKKEDFGPNMQALVDNGAVLTFAPGYQLADALKSVAENNPDVHFCMIDAVVDLDNVISITFKEEEGSFLMGVIAGLTTKTNKVGFIGGKDQEAIVKFEAGYAAGVKAVNPEAAAGLISADGSATGSTVKYADSFSDTNKGYELAKSLYESGCDIIYHAAGGVGIGMFQATKELRESGKDVWAIGVDMDQAVSLPDYASVILSSMVKRVDKATYDTVKAVIDGNINYEPEVLGVAEGGVGMADTTSTNTSAEVIEKTEEYSNRVKEGKIEVPSTRQGAIDFKVE